MVTIQPCNDFTPSHGIRSLNFSSIFLEFLSISKHWSLLQREVQRMLAYV